MGGCGVASGGVHTELAAGGPEALPGVLSGVMPGPVIADGVGRGCGGIARGCVCEGGSVEVTGRIAGIAGEVEGRAGWIPEPVARTDVDGLVPIIPRGVVPGEVPGFGGFAALAGMIWLGELPPAGTW